MKTSSLIRLLLIGVLCGPSASGAPGDLRPARFAAEAPAPGCLTAAALGAPILAGRLDRLLERLDRTFERLFGNFAGSVYGRPAAAYGPDLGMGVFSVAESAESGGEAREPDEDRDFADAERTAGRLAWGAIRLQIDMERNPTAQLAPRYLRRLAGLRRRVEELLGPRPIGVEWSSAQLEVMIDQMSVTIREATLRRDERRLDRLNAQVRRMLAARIRLQLDTTERELRRGHWPMAAASLFSAAKSIWRLRIEYFWARVRIFRRLNLGDFLSLEGLKLLSGYLIPGMWPGGPIVRRENRRVLVDEARRIWAARKTTVVYDHVRKFLRGQYKTLAQEFGAAVEILYQMAYIRYVQLLLEFFPTVQDLRKSRRDLKVIRQWADRGTGDERQAMRPRLADADSALGDALRFRGPSYTQDQYDEALGRAQRHIQAARRIIFTRLPAIKNIRESILVKAHAFIERYLHPDTPPEPPDRVRGIVRSS